MADYRCPMITIGIIHIIDGLLIPAGITGIIASSGNSRRAVNVCIWFNSFGFAAAGAIITFAAIITSTNIVTDSDAGAIGAAIATVLLGVLEMILCCIAGTFSSRILRGIVAMEAATVTYSGDGVANPGMQNPEAQVQIQYPAQPPQGQYPGAPDQGQYPGPPAQGQYPGPPAQGQYPGPQAQGQYPGAPAQGQYPSAPVQYPATEEQKY
ncbi:uncharacterized protein LOC119732353 [Patiria miniata]|uniref:Uncharacterized protein n=1 Tax=Patiria miniata TaxID=46514 RepID=A0A914AEF1_PATMI|nr:uncharacterized protein LOC119732353 [Patiria miniata]